MADAKRPETPRGAGAPASEPGPEPTFTVVDRRPSYDDGDAAPADPPREPTVVQELRARAEEAERRTREISAAYRQIDAERDAFRERLTRDLERRVDIGRADLMRRVLPVLDDLDRALQATRGEGPEKSLAAGVALIRERLRQALAAEGVEPIETAGAPFDPAVAEAVSTESTTDPAKDGLVIEELERGYRLGGALLRPARVRVARLAGE
jgi:molecular chaperone GrpE (heat shock protein)